MYVAVSPKNDSKSTYIKDYQKWQVNEIKSCLDKSYLFDYLVSSYFFGIKELEKLSLEGILNFESHTLSKY